MRHIKSTLENEMRWSWGIILEDSTEVDGSHSCSSTQDSMGGSFLDARSETSFVSSSSNFSNKDLKRKIDGLGDKLEEMWDELRPDNAGRRSTGERRRARGELQTQYDTLLKMGSRRNLDYEDLCFIAMEKKKVREEIARLDDAAGQGSWKAKRTERAAGGRSG
eukprot:3470238-Rhodomonas_salina.1